MNNSNVKIQKLLACLLVIGGILTLLYVALSHSQLASVQNLTATDITCLIVAFTLMTLASILPLKAKT